MFCNIEHLYCKVEAGTVGKDGQTQLYAFGW